MMHTDRPRLTIVLLGSEGYCLPYCYSLALEVYLWIEEEDGEPEEQNRTEK
jgi:hypothetical protein